MKTKENFPKQTTKREKVDFKSLIEKKREIYKDKIAIRQMMFIMIKNKMLTQMIINNIYQLMPIKQNQKMLVVQKKR